MLLSFIGKLSHVLMYDNVILIDYLFQPQELFSAWQVCVDVANIHDLLNKLDKYALLSDNIPTILLKRLPALLSLSFYILFSESLIVGKENVYDIHWFK